MTLDLKYIEIEILTLLSKGHTQGEAARRVGLTTGGAASRLRQARDRNNVRRTWQLIEIAKHEGIISDC